MRDARTPNTAAWHIAGSYAIFAALWILFSDRVVAALGNHDILQTYKGMAFVVVTASMLWVLVFRSTSRQVQAREQLVSVVSTSPAGICIIDGDGSVGLWNPAAESMLGWRAHDVLGGPSPLSIPEQSSAERDQAPEGAFGAVFSETILPTATGGQLEVAYAVTDVPDAGSGRPGKMLVFLDITARKAAERELAIYRENLERMVSDRTLALETANSELEQVTRAKSEFLAVMSHELRTPLNAIIGFTSILLDGMAGDLNEEQTRQLGMVRSAGEHLHTLINDVLDISKIEAGRMSFDAAPFYVGALIDECVTLFPQQMVKSGVELKVEEVPRLAVFADRLRAKQVLMNILGNAMRYTQEGTVTISVRTDEGRVGVSVTDTGPGIAPDDLEQVFAQFHRLERKDFPTVEGSGLGLPISRRLARLMGGDVTVESEIGTGSTFTFWLPTSAVYTELSGTN